MDNINISKLNNLKYFLTELKDKLQSWQTYRETKNLVNDSCTSWKQLSNLSTKNEPIKR